MSDVSISYKGTEIAALDDSGTKTLLTSGKYCEGDIEVVYTKPSGGGTLPDEYQEVEYIENTGTAKIIPNQKSRQGHTKIVIEASFTSTTSKTSILFGTSSSLACWFGMLPNGDVGVSGKQFQNVTYSKKNTYEVRWGATSLSATCVDESISSTSGTPSENTQFAIFDSYASAGYPAKAKVYSVKFFFDNGVIADLIPCYRVADGAIGMYDVLNNEFYTNSGGGSFSKGSDVLSAQQALNVLMGVSE
jgi:hypothetical protein